MADLVGLGLVEDVAGGGARQNLELLRTFGIEGKVRAEVVALPPGHPYLRLPLQFSVGLEPRLLSFVDAEELSRLQQEAETELAEPGRWGTTFTVIQSWGRRVPVGGTMVPAPRS